MGTVYAMLLGLCVLSRLFIRDKTHGGVPLATSDGLTPAWLKQRA